jgi:hypothetical protein
MKSIVLTIVFISTALLAQTSIPPGTILPGQLNSSLNSRKSKPGEMITARLMQDVPLPSGKKIRAGAKIIGRIEIVKAAGANQGAQITLRFDELKVARQIIPIATNLRALASMMEVEDAQVPPMGTDRGTPWAWMTRNLIGGDVAYGQGGPVEHANREVERALLDGVLAPIRANPARGCPGKPGDDTQPQAFWVFSSDACGVYGLEELRISYAGRTNPIGVVTLISTEGNFEVRGGSGLLLRVLGSTTHHSLR